MGKPDFKQVLQIPADSVKLSGVLTVPLDSQGVVIFAHGSGSSRHSQRNIFVADTLQEAGIGTLLFDLLTLGEDLVYENRFDIDLLTGRLKAVTLWLRKQPQTTGLKTGYFGASTGAAAALRAAADLGSLISAVVSRGGRPDMAREDLVSVTAPTLLIVGEYDRSVIKINQAAIKLIKAEKELAIVPEASHLFEEPGKLEEVASLAADWFTRHLILRKEKARL